MTRVVPSQVVELILRAYPEVDRLEENNGLAHTEGPILVGILELVEQIPNELIMLKGDDYNSFVASVSTIRFITTKWQHMDLAGAITRVRGFRGHVLTLLLNALRKCPDEAPSRGVSGLEFVADEDYRKVLCTDLSAAHSANMNGEWKAATVLAGSIIEALLLWGLEQVGEKEAQSKIPWKTKPLPLTEWHLPQYVDASEALELIDKHTAIQARSANNYRNLIHPGRAARLQQTCTRGTAMATLAGAEEVAIALERRFSGASEPRPRSKT